jgi:ribosome-associated protein
VSPRDPTRDIRTQEPTLTLTSTEKAVTAARAAAEKLGLDTVVLDVGDVLSIVEYFVIVSAPNVRQVKAIADEVRDQVREAGDQGTVRAEGLDDLHWVLIDFGDVVVHVFLDETREFYELERLWGDVARVDWQAESDRAVN